MAVSVTPDTIVGEYNVIAHYPLFAGGSSNYLSIPSGTTWTRLAFSGTGGLPAITNGWFLNWRGAMKGTHVRLNFVVNGKGGYVTGDWECYEASYGSAAPSTSTSGNVAVRTNSNQIQGAADRGLNFISTAPFNWGGDSRYMYVRHSVATTLGIYAIGMDLIAT